MLVIEPGQVGCQADPGPGTQDIVQLADIGGVQRADDEPEPERTGPALPCGEPMTIKGSYGRGD